MHGAAHEPVETSLIIALTPMDSGKIIRHGSLFMRIIASIVKFLQNGHSRKGVPAVPAKLRLHPSRV